ncbi:AI-2E family transporter [Paenibacillus sp. LMG 31456]|uniref:AI-2E family transporter n=1 Tax=Paenibacillus foliorum TaxID=2654974 RepID=A0A972GJ70_9BACL|nr:AI-2E family transporter [Paenibacillus foliorum]NOU91781.1 AI-2E family transporter [Paenibacillus foliorum]
MPNSKLFRLGYGILLIFLIIWVGDNIEFIFQPLLLIIQTLFTPLLIAGILFYLLRPLLNILIKRKVPISLSILLIYFVIVFVVIILIIIVGPMIKVQFTSLINDLPMIIENAVAKGYELAKRDWFAQFIHSFNLDPEKISQNAAAYSIKLLNLVASNLSSFIGFITNLFILVVMIPFILYYFLKDGHKMLEGLLKILPHKSLSDSRKLFSEMDRTISLYIRGQIMVAVCVGVLMLIGFKIIGLNYAILLALFAMVTNVIPYLGAFLAAVPALLVGLTISPGMVIKVLVVTLIAQQIEGNLITPLIIRKGLDIHPLTIILLLFVIGTIVGPIGLLFAVPGYAICKVVIVYIYRFIRLRNEEIHRTD